MHELGTKRLAVFTASLLIFGAWQYALAKADTPEVNARPEVQVGQGRVRGALLEGGFAFKNLPYAAPPVGPNRWRAPHAAPSWKGVRDASVFGASCPQLRMGWNNAVAEHASEDCLSLNIWTPRLGHVTAQPGLPVMVWIHGGGFTGGSASDDFMDGAKLMRHGVVVVTINYRLGVLGFLAHPDLAREASDGSTGNYGLMDQVAALQWINDNIAAFGGDPANITAFGESAGAISISWLTTSDSARGLFERAILESGNAFGSGLITRTRAKAEQVGQQFGAITQLRRLPAQKLLQRWEGYEARAPQEHFADPILDGHLFRMQPAKALLDGTGSNVAVIVGSNSQEFPSDQPLDQLHPFILSYFGDQSEKALGYYFPEGKARLADPLLGSAGTQLSADVMFRCSSILSGRASSIAWLYQFEQPQPGGAVTAHAHELVYVFGNWLPEWALKQPMSKAELALVDQMQSYWSNFARTGDPNGPDLPPWPRYRRRDDPYLAISAEHTTARTQLRGDICPLYVAHWSEASSYDALAKE
jgi:para-nitrobenzyl esterase